MEKIAWEIVICLLGVAGMAIGFSALPLYWRDIRDICKRHSTKNGGG